MSKYVSVRKAAQRALDPITQVYDGSRSMLYDTYLAALQRESAQICHRQCTDSIDLSW